MTTQITISMQNYANVSAKKTKEDFIYREQQHLQKSKL